MAAAAHYSEADPAWEAARIMLAKLDELTRRLQSVRKSINQLDREVEELTIMLSELTGDLDRPRKSVIRRSANRFVGSVEAFLEFAQAAPGARTPLQHEQLSKSWERLWEDLREKLGDLADDIQEI